MGKVVAIIGFKALERMTSSQGATASEVPVYTDGLEGNYWASSRST